MKALEVEISFEEAFFKVHYTKGFRLTYPVPLPTTVVGMFGALFGVERDRLKNEFKNVLAGAKVIKYEGIINESATFMQYKSKKSKGVVRGVTKLSFINSPTYLIVIASNDEGKIEDYKKRLEEQRGIKYLPYGGQNDFFPLDWKVRDINEVEDSKEITNYAPQDWVGTQILEKGSEIQILPVRHNLSKNQNFYFVINGKLVLNRKIPATKNEKIGLYSLESFRIK
jgi:CRISPR-associated protein Cas5 subtype I-B